MIKHIRLTGYKGISTIQLANLGQINVICGKNNSGKSSILEAMAVRNFNGLGVAIDDSIKELFKPFSRRYSTPVPSQSEMWFNKLIDIASHHKEIWYDSEIKDLTEKLKQAMQQDEYLRTYDNKTFDFETMLKNLFLSIIEDYKPYLIPPKRSIAFEKPISTDENIAPTGDGIMNKLFFLKNQDIKSNDYKVYMSIYKEFEFITERNFNIFPKKENRIELMFNNKKGEWISSRDCGLGLSDVLIILGLVYLTNCNVYLIEEPENHLHAEYQKRLLDFFRRQKSYQFFLATHSNVFLDPNNVDKIIYTEFHDNVTVSDVTSRSVIISSLGYSISDNLSSDLIILTEGPTDIPILKEILSWKGLDLQYNIKFWPLGGDMMTSLDLAVLAQDHELIAIIDSDFQSKEHREAFIKNCGDLKIDCYQLERYAIENYFSLDAIRSVFGVQVPTEVTKMDNKKSIKKQLGFNIKSKNHQIIRKMSLLDFEGTDLIKYCDVIEAKLRQIP
jgi:AAA15 family ATPase/GTPase